VIRGEPIQIVVATSSFASGPYEFSLELFSYPPNDSLANAELLAGESVTVQSNWAGSSEPGEPSFLGPHTLWWKWTAAHSGQVLVKSALRNAPVFLWLFTGSELSNLVLVPLSGESFVAEAGRTYFLGVGWRDGNSTPFLTVNQDSFGLRFVHLVPNDSFANRVFLEGEEVAFQAESRLSTLEPGEPDFQGAGGSMWWSWIAPKTGVASISLEPGGAFAVYRGENLADLKLDPGERLGFRVQAGERLVIAAYSYFSQPSWSDDQPFSLRIHLYESPANDAFADRFFVSGGDLDPDRLAVLPGEFMGAAFGPSRPRLQPEDRSDDRFTSFTRRLAEQVFGDPGIGLDVASREFTWIELPQVLGVDCHHRGDVHFREPVTGKGFHLLSLGGQGLRRS
jgi:hypothetical protein